MAKPSGARNSAAFDALLKGPEVRGEIKRLVDQAALSAGPGFESETSTGRGRALGMVYPATRAARRREAKDHILMRVQDTMRDSS